MDKAAGAHIRFRLGGVSILEMALSDSSLTLASWISGFESINEQLFSQVRFPPNIYYKIYTHRPIVDMCACSPRNYTAMEYRLQQARDRNNVNPRIPKGMQKQVPMKAILAIISTQTDH